MHAVRACSGATAPGESRAGPGQRRVRCWTRAAVALFLDMQIEYKLCGREGDSRESPVVSVDPQRRLARVNPARRSATSALLLCVVLSAATARAESARGALHLSFAATSTLHDFEGTTGPVAVSLSQDANRSLVGGRERSRWRRLKTGNRPARREHARRCSTPRTIPQILGRFRGVDPERVRSSGMLPFVLQIRTVERPVEAASRTGSRASARPASTRPSTSRSRLPARGAAARSSCASATAVRVTRPS